MAVGKVDEEGEGGQGDEDGFSEESGEGKKILLGVLVEGEKGQGEVEGGQGRGEEEGVKYGREWRRGKLSWGEDSGIVLASIGIRVKKFAV